MVRLKDIADATGLTVSTVSKALHGSREISRETTERVVEAARSMGYVHKRSANLNVKTIGVILPEVQSQYYARLMQNLNREIGNRGYLMITLLTPGFGVGLEETAEKMGRYFPDGLIVCAAQEEFSREPCEVIKSLGIPTIILDEFGISEPIDTICFQGMLGIRQAIDHLLELGHRRIGYLGEFNSDIRYETFCEALKQNEIPVEERFVKRTGKRFEAGGYEVGCELIKEPLLPTAVIASYDQLALGAMKAFLDHGLHVPEDISIIGFDNIVMDDYYPVPLTSVTQPVEQMAVTAVKILLDAIRNPKTHVVQNVYMQSRLVVRGSTCPPRQGSDRVRS